MIESMRLEYVSSHQIGSLCTSVTHHEDNILLGCRKGLKKYDRNTEEMRLLKSGIVKVAQYNGDIFISHRKSGFVSVMKYSETATDHLFSFTTHSMLPYFLSISDPYVAIIDHDNEQIKLYNRHTRHVTDITLPNTSHINGTCASHQMAAYLLHHGEKNTTLTQTMALRMTPMMILRMTLMMTQTVMIPTFY